MQTTLSRATPTVTWRRGLVWGLTIGASIWGAYFIQASVLDGWFWDVTVVPALGLVLVSAVILGAVRPQLRSFNFGLAAGALASLVIALLAFALLFAVADLE